VRIVSGAPGALKQDTASAERTIESCWKPTGRNAGRIVLKLSGADSISAAEELAGMSVLVPSEALPELDEDTYFVRDLIGATLWDGDAPVGEIVDVEFAMAPDGRTRLEDAAPLLVVRAQPLVDDEASLPQSGDEPEEVEETALVPFIRAWLVEVDLAHKRVLMRLPAGLLETPAP
jgi:16S rRNA processing protein RimM